MENKKEKIQVGIFPKNRENPFLKETIEEVQKNIVKKYKHSSNQSESAILQAIDPKTGEYVGHTTFIRQMKVDEEKFTKIYNSKFSAFWDLKKQAMKVLDYIMNQLKPNQDKFEFIIDECLKHTKYKSPTSIYQGLRDLLKAEIIARGYLETTYFINPMIMFNGNRITFTNTYLKIPKNQKQQYEYQEEQLSIQSQENNQVKVLKEKIKMLENQLEVKKGNIQLTLEEAISNES